MAVQVNPIAPSLPATTAIQDPAVRQFANAVADALRASNSPEGSVKALVEALEAVGKGSQVSPAFGLNGTPQGVSEIYKSRLYDALKSPVAQIVQREGLGSAEALEVIEDNNTVIVNALNAMWATVGASGVFTEDGKNIVANWTTAQAEKWSQIEAEVLSAGGQTIRAALAEESDARATLEGQVSASWMIKAEVDVGTGKPYVAGIALGAEGQGGAATSEFLVRADRFAMVMPGYGEYIPFAIGDFGPEFSGLTSWSNVTGANKPQDGATVGAEFGKNITGQITSSNVTTYIANAAIGNAQIDRATVNKLVVSSADIADAAITSAKIADAQISSAKIQDAAVEYLKIAGQAVSVSSFVNGTSLTISVPPGGGNIFIVANIIHNPLNFYVNVRRCYLYFDGVTVSQAYVNCTFSDASYGAQPGSNTLSIVIFAAQGNHTISISSTAAIDSATISATILRR